MSRPTGTRAFGITYEFVVGADGHVVTKGVYNDEWTGKWGTFTSEGESIGVEIGVSVNFGHYVGAPSDNFLGDGYYISGSMGSIGGAAYFSTSRDYVGYSVNPGIGIDSGVSYGETKTCQGLSSCSKESIGNGN